LGFSRASFSSLFTPHLAFLFLSSGAGHSGI